MTKKQRPWYNTPKNPIITTVLRDLEERAVGDVLLTTPHPGTHEVMLIDDNLEPQLIPHLRSWKNPEPTQDDGTTTFVIGNFTCKMPDVIVPEFVWFIANAMAIAAGYTSFSTHSVPRNPYKTYSSTITKEFLQHKVARKSTDNPAEFNVE